MKSGAAKARLGFIVILVSGVCASVGLGVVVYLQIENENRLESFAIELRDGLVASCQDNGNPLREAVRHQINEQIQQREALDYSLFFPNVPAAELEALVGEQNEADRETLKEIAPLDCPSLYPSP